MNERISESRIRNNRMRRRRELRRRILMSILTLVFAVGFSLIFFSFRAKAQSSDEEILYKYYKSVVVEEGDTIWGYAQQYGDTSKYDNHQDYINEVIQMNSLSNETITAGQYIILPYYSPEFVG